MYMLQYYRRFVYNCLTNKVHQRIMFYVLAVVVVVVV